MLPSRILILALLPLVQIGCSHTSSSTRTAATPLPPDLKIVVGEGGGFSGLWSGYSILSSDTVLQWKGRSFGESPAYAGTIPHDSLTALWQSVVESGLLNQSSNVIQANYVQALAITSQGSEHMFAWEPGAASGSTTAAAITLRTRCLETIHNSLRP